MSLNFIIIGAQKAATSFVHDCLREHPSVQMAIEEIPSFESPDYEHGGKESILNSYSAPQGMICGIKRPSYLGKPEVPDRIHALCPGAKLILVLRNPVDRAVSAYFHYVKHRFIPFTDLSTGMERLLDGSLQTSHPAAKDILEYGFYGRHLRTYLNRFPKVQIHILFHEDIVADGKQVIRSVYRFLGIDPEYQPESIDSRPQAVLFQPLSDPGGEASQPVAIQAQCRPSTHHRQAGRSRIPPGGAGATQDRPENIGAHSEESQAGSAGKPARDLG